jgi:putative resolvase
MKLSHYAKLNGVHYQTAYRWFVAGLIPTARQLPNGTILVDQINVNPPVEKVVTYARVSNASRRKELDYQVKRLQDFCESKGLTITNSYKEVASGMNDSRKQLWKMIDSCPTTIVIENKDRLTRFGFKYLSQLLEKQGTKIIVINESETDEQDLIRDLVSIITSFCCRLYGLRRGHSKSKKITQQITTPQ